MLFVKIVDKQQIKWLNIFVVPTRGDILLKKWFLWLDISDLE